MLISRMHRTLREDESGQALVLGAATMLILALSVMVTIQIGSAIEQRIQVQNAADNAAFSVTAAVARTMNFIAWMNRASVANYVSMMAAQSTAAFVNALWSLFWMLTDMVQTIGAIACYIAKICSLCKGVPIVGIACAACETAFTIIYELIDAVANVMYGALNAVWSLVDGLDSAMGQVVDKISLLNQNIMWITAWGMKEATFIFLLNFGGSFMDKVIEDTAGTCNETNNATGIGYRAAMSLLNGADSYRNMFDPDSEDIPEGGTEAANRSLNRTNGVQNAERLMAEIANGSRTGDGDGGFANGLTFETSRGWGKNTGDNSNSWISKLGDALDYLGFEYYGQTRLVGHMSKETFTEGTGGLQDAVSGAVGGFMEKADNCNTKQQECQTAESQLQTAISEYNTAESQYGTAQSAANAANAKCSQTGAQADCDDAREKQDDADGKRRTRDEKFEAKNEAQRRRDNICEEAEDTCDQLNTMSKDSGTSAQDTSNGKQNHVWNNGEDVHQYTRGGAIASAEWVKALGLSIISGGGGRILGIQTSYKTSDSDGKSYHCRLADEEDDRHTQMEIAGCPPYAYTKDTKCLNEDGRHSWHGISKYVSLKANDDAAKSFNQPSYWAAVNKAPEAARFKADLAFGFDSQGQFAYNYGGKTVRFDNMNKPGLESGFMAGLNAFSRAQLYYHRPTYWQEPPNLFNPYWRAKLAPVGPEIDDLLGNVPGGGLLTDVIKEFITH